MAPVTIPPTEEARTVFRRLGYAISEEDSEFVAERKWRRVRVTPLCADDAKKPESVLGEESDEGLRLRCFVTWMQCTGELREYLRSVKPPYDWAIIGVEEDDDEAFEVVHPDTTLAPA
ncbi:DUF7116 family protein [Halohasta litorea]|uniref:Uncharacterized protein n=1 Tax=Halohasta litorea TaxID=869891 RepID=A0ABD6DAJ0_9EURY|nr:hypothetical protein [Halohasta litorea]MEA1931698.1 hypothetical protein [Euryarchaeota archaeon]